VEHEIKTAGDILFQLELSDENLLKLEGLGEKALEEIKEAVAKYLPKAPEPVVVAETTPIEEIVAELVAETVAADGQQPEAAAEVEAEIEAEPVVEAVAMTPAEELEAALADVTPIEDLEKPLIPLVKTPEKVAEKPKAKPAVVIARPVREEETEDEAKRKQKGKELVFDESQGKVVVKRKRKGSRRRPEWEEFGDDDF
jgi:hypothetical protein